MEGYWARILLVAGLVSLVTAALVPVARRLAYRCQIIDHPKPGKVHRTVTPYLGGLAIAPVAAAASWFLPQWKAEAVVIACAAIAVAAVGLVDDIRSLSPTPRLIVEVMAATAAYAVGARVNLFGGPADYLLTVLWLVVLTNAFNLLDNMDGCAGLIALVMASGMALAAGLEGQVLVGGLAALVAGACLGFLPANWHPASIFMGDAGSLFLGFILSTISLKLRFSTSYAQSISALFLLTGPALFDTTLVVISRIRNGQSIFIGGTDHTSHRLMRLGLSVPQVATLLAGAAALCAGTGVAVGHGLLPVLPVMSVMVSLGVASLVALLRVPVSEEGAVRDGRQTVALGPGLEG